MNKRIEIWFGGIGGQGVVYAANLLGQAAGDRYDYVAATAHYGPESRGGLTSAELVLSQSDKSEIPARPAGGSNQQSTMVAYPYIESPNILVIMHQRSLADIPARPTGGPKDLTALTHIIYDSTLVSNLSLRATDDIGAKQSHSAFIAVPATQLAREKFCNIQMANLILVGALVKATRIVEPEAVFGHLKDASAKQAVELGLSHL